MAGTIDKITAHRSSRPETAKLLSMALTTGIEICGASPFYIDCAWNDKSVGFAAEQVAGLMVRSTFWAWSRTARASANPQQLYPLHA